MMTLEEAVQLKDGAKIQAVAEMHGKIAQRSQGVWQVFFKHKRQEFLGDHAAEMTKPAYIKISDSLTSTWALVREGESLVHSSKSPLRDIAYTVQEVILLSDHMQKNIGLNR